MFLLALQLGGNNYPWKSSVVIGLFCGAGVLGIIFLLWERRMSDRAMIPFSIVGKRIIYCSALNGSALVVAILVSAQYLPIYFQGVLGYKPAMSGVNILPSILSQMTTVILSGFLGLLSEVCAKMSQLLMPLQSKKWDTTSRSRRLAVPLAPSETASCRRFHLIPRLLRG